MTRVLIAVVLLCTSGAIAADRKPVVPSNGPKPVGPYMPGILVGDYLYVSGQGGRNPAGDLAADQDGQIRQCLENVKAVVEASGLTMKHVVYTQVYLTDPTDEGPLNKLYKEYFPADPPARSTIGVTRLPGGTPVEISAVAYRDLAQRKSVVPPNYPKGFPISAGVLTGDRFYLSGFLGRDINTGRIPGDPAEQVRLSFTRMEATLKAAALDFRHLVFVNPYITGRVPMDVMNKVYAEYFEFGNTPARATIAVSALPSNAGVEFTGVAVRNLADRKVVRPRNMPPSATASPCVFAGSTLYCSAKSGFIPGVHGGIFGPTVGTQLRQTMRNLLDGLEQAGMSLSNVVAAYVYLDNIDDFAAMNKVYGEYFNNSAPTRTTIQPNAPAARQADSSERWPVLEQISLIAVK